MALSTWYSMIILGTDSHTGWHRCLHETVDKNILAWGIKNKLRRKQWEPTTWLFLELSRAIQHVHVPFATTNSPSSTKQVSYSSRSCLVLRAMPSRVDDWLAFPDVWLQDDGGNFWHNILCTALGQLFHTNIIDDSCTSTWKSRATQQQNVKVMTQDLPPAILLSCQWTESEENSGQNVFSLVPRRQEVLTMNNQGLRQSILSPWLLFQLWNMNFYFLHTLTWSSLYQVGMQALF